LNVEWKSYEWKNLYNILTKGLDPKNIQIGQSCIDYIIILNSQQVLYSEKTETLDWNMIWEGQKVSLSDHSPMWSDLKITSDKIVKSSFTSVTIDGFWPRVYYLGSDNHVYQLWWYGSWHLQDLTKYAKATDHLAAERSALTSVKIDSKSPRVYYLGNDNHIYQLWYNSSDDHWNLEDLTTLAPGATEHLAAAGSALTSVVIDGIYPRVYYLGSDNHVYQLWFDGSWHLEDLTTLAPGATEHLAAAGSALTSVVIDGKSPRVYYLGSDNHVYQLWYDGSWHLEDLTTLAPGATDRLAAAGSALTSVIIDGKSPRVYYLGSDNYVNQLWYDSSWHHGI